LMATNITATEITRDNSHGATTARQGKSRRTPAARPAGSAGSAVDGVDESVSSRVIGSSSTATSPRYPCESAKPAG
jgi:hypothetical protein